MTIFSLSFFNTTEVVEVATMTPSYTTSMPGDLSNFARPIAPGYACPNPASRLTGQPLNPIRFYPRAAKS
ncbi:hypothetical protein ACJJIF_19725 [Microbulbifer sp. SSSA002]|uniref:hypothetical protein n=1 Tax=unclassified Microbulbifer TaxID=2619833 RepID=UPI004039D6FB